MIKLFGADGIRGEIDVYPMDADGIARFGFAIGAYLREKHKTPVCLLGTDTRESSQRLKRRIIDSLNVSGITTVDAGIIPTSAISYLLAHKGLFSAGIMISASHNPITENGVKVFAPTGIKLSDQEEKIVETFFWEYKPKKYGHYASNRVEKDYIDQYAKAIYREFKGHDWHNVNLILDCANGAAHIVAPKILSMLGCKFHLINYWPDGTNINYESGSEFAREDPEKIYELLKTNQKQLSISLDGDADRVLIYDIYRNYYDGDSLLAILGSLYKEQGKLKNNKVVTTVMSNQSIKGYFSQLRVGLKVVENGDKNVTNALISDDLVLGGEQVGHLIFHDHPDWVTGDGLRTTLKVLSELIINPDVALYEMSQGLHKTPQIVASIKLDKKTQLKKEQIPGLLEQLEEIEFNYPDIKVSQCRPASTESSYRLLLESTYTPSSVLSLFAKRISKCIYKNIETKEQEVRILDCVIGGVTTI